MAAFHAVRGSGSRLEIFGAAFSGCKRTGKSRTQAKSGEHCATEELFAVVKRHDLAGGEGALGVVEADVG